MTNKNLLKDMTGLRGKIGRRMSGEITVDAIRVDSLLREHMGQNCSIVIEAVKEGPEE